MASITYAECHWYWESLMLSVTDTESHLCWVPLILSATNKPFMLILLCLMLLCWVSLYWVSLVVNVIDTECHRCCVLFTLSVTYTESHLCWVSLILSATNKPFILIVLCLMLLCWVLWCPERGLIKWPGHFSETRLSIQRRRIRRNVFFANVTNALAYYALLSLTTNKKL